MVDRLSTHHVTHQMVVFGLSDQGLQRDNNEDHFMVADLTRKVIGVHANQLCPELFHHDIGRRGTVLMVADGLGGHEGGEIASQIAVDAVARALVAAVEPVLPMSEQIIRAVHTAHAAICKYHGTSGRTRHMASTLTAVHVGHGVMTVAQVGDSRAYRFSGGKLTLLTDDQTVVHMMQKKGMLTPEEAHNHPHRNIILQALGQDKPVFPEIQTLPFAHNDCLLLCSDGLSSYVAHEHIEEMMAAGEDEHELCRHLVEAANAAGGADNVTVLLARLLIKERIRVATPGRLPAASVPRPANTAPPPGDSSEPQAPAPARLPIWKRATQWWWGHKAASSPTSHAPEPVNARPDARQSSPWRISPV
jgi:protein phosphatase